MLGNLKETSQAVKHLVGSLGLSLFTFVLGGKLVGGRVVDVMIHEGHQVFCKPAH